MLIEAKIIEYLAQTLGCEVFAELPEVVHTEKFVLITVVNRSKSNQISRVTVDIYSYADSKAECAALDDLVRQFMPITAGLNEISSCKQTNGDDVPDVWLNKYRYRSVFNIVYYDD